jgi:hypothetical protein
MDINKLAIQNPWWEGEALEYDPVLEEYDCKKLQWQWDLFKDSELKKDQIYFIRGARGLGKTSLFKNLIRDLLNEQGVAPDRVLYCACYNLSGFEELNETVKAFIKDRRSGKQKKRLYLFLDEVVMAVNWQYGLKRLKENGLLKNVTIICSGSLSEKNMEDGIKIKSMSPLSFPEFLSLSDPGLAGGVKDAKSLEYYLDAYFLTGGFPSAINDFHVNKAVKQKIYDDFLYWLIADITFTGRDMFLARQIMENIVHFAGVPTGYKTLAQNTKAKTHLTVKDYLEILERMFGVNILYQANGKGELATSKSKKIYFGDPFLFWLFYCYIHQSLHYWRFSRQSLHRYDIFKFLKEQVVFNHLTKIKGSPRIAYWRDIHRREAIDFLVITPKKTIPVILAHENRGAGQCRRVLERAGFRQGIIINESGGTASAGKIKELSLLRFLLDFEKYF